jgi:beta-glucuronidase
MHDESFLKSGVAYDRADAEAQLGLIKELNGNFIRLAHYPHNEHTVRLADELGLMIWSEVPIVTQIDWSNSDTLEIALSQISDNLYRDLNRASIVMWSIANETMPQSPERLAFLEQLADRARAIDLSGRPIAAALVGNPTEEFPNVIKRLVAEMLRDPEITDPAVRAHLQGMAAKMTVDDLETVRDSEMEVMLTDPLGEVVDIIGYNQYFGWYYSAFMSSILPVDQGTTRRNMLKLMRDIRFRNAFGKPIVISEFGAGAKKGYVSDKGPGMIWSEEYQARVYEAQMDMLKRSDFVQGMSPWVLKDFRSAMRSLNGIQDIYNRKGLVSEKGEKKKAFYVLRDFYKQKASGT